MSHLIIELCGGAFDNKGDQLMLWATLQHLRAQFPGVKMVMDPQRSSFSSRAAYGIYQKFGERRFGRMGFIIDRLMHKGYREKFGLITEKEIAAVIDLSGFAYGDQWGTRWMTGRAANARRWKKQGKKVIILPQALGPFLNPEVRELAAEILGSADLVYARDTISQKEALDLGIHNVLRCPDITHLVEGRNASDAVPKAPWACVIPNTQMIRMTSSDIGSQYVSFMTDMIRRLQARGLNPHLLQHDTKHDPAVIDKINAALDSRVPIIREEDPVLIKGIEGAASLVVGSRFHSLVNALSQAVPVLATSWSHKYEELLTEYGCPECLISHETPSEKINTLLDAITQDPGRTALIKRLRDAAASFKQQVVEMWNRVDALLSE